MPKGWLVPKLRALDLFCGGGGVSRGLANAGFDITGVDISPQRYYPYRFIQADALTVSLRGYDFIWASPPCQKFSAATRPDRRGDHRDLISLIRGRLRRRCFAIENVPAAPLLSPVTLCGQMFGLRVIRHRVFETSFPLEQPTHEPHRGSLITGEFITVAGTGIPSWIYNEREKRGLPKYNAGEHKIETWQAAMGIDWLPRRVLVEAIPPAYAEYVGRAAIREIRRSATESGSPRPGQSKTRPH